MARTVAFDPNIAIASVYVMASHVSAVANMRGALLCQKNNGRKLRNAAKPKAALILAGFGWFLQRRRLMSSAVFPMKVPERSSRAVSFGLVCCDMNVLPQGLKPGCCCVVAARLKPRPFKAKAMSSQLLRW